jgi:hypothetical protein
MKLNKKTIFAASGLAIAATLAASFSVPTTSAAWSTIGGNLGTGQRDYRVFNNFTDAAANNNNVPHVNFPGHQGAVMSIWKACAEWASVPHAGNGLGDGLASNPVIGSGGANFDAKFEGTASIIGNTNQNIHSEQSGSSGGTLAYTETPISDGWRIRYLSGWTWGDGPGSVGGSQIDLQGVACHEYGHALGLGHSGASGATMRPSISGTGVGQRSINSDDSAGVQAIYGVKSGSKPEITAISGTLEVGSTLTITGFNFSPTGNQVWFTKAASDGVSIKLTGVGSTGGGTQIQVTIPSGAVDGDVLVRFNGSGHTSLSNAWPIDVGGGVAGPFITSINPLFGPAGGWTDVEFVGAGFSGATSVTFNGTPALSFNVVNDGIIDAVTPPGPLLVTVDVEVTTPLGSHELTSAFTYVFDTPPFIDTVVPSTGPTAGGTPVTISGLNVVGVTDVTFGGVSGTGLTITSPTSLTVTTPPGSAGDVDVVADGAGMATIVDGFTYTGGGPGGTFVDIGPSGTGGAFGDPVHTGAGDLTPGGTGFTLDLSSALPLSPAVLFVAVGDGIPSPFKGGTHYAIPIALEIGLTTSVGGGFTLPAAIPVSIPSGFKFVTQFWVADALAVLGAAGSNGLKSTVP